jgi:hypothetical protein
MERNNHEMSEEKRVNFRSPDLSKMKEVVIDYRTKIYIARDADPEEAKKRFYIRFANRKE